MKAKKNKLETTIIIIVVGLITTSTIKNFHNKMWQEAEKKTELKAKAALADIKESYCIYEYKTQAKITEKCPTPNWKPNQELIDYCLTQASSYNSPYSKSDCLAHLSKDSATY